MRIGIAGPIALSTLESRFPAGTHFPEVYSFPMVAWLAERLHARGHEIVIFSLSRQVSRTQHFMGDRMQAYVCPQRRPRWQMLDFFRGERQALVQAMHKARCDVVHAHWTYEFGHAAVESGLPHVVTAHCNPMVALRFSRHPYGFEKTLLAWKVLRKAQALTAVSPYLADSLNRFLRPQRDTVVVCNGVKPEVFAMGEKRQPKRARGRVIFASVLNGWAGRKNGQTLVEAFALLRKQINCEVELWMFGYQHQSGGPAETWVNQRSMNSGIRFMGWVPNAECLRMLAESVDVLVHPSLEEAHCMALIEAMAIGLPVIGSNSGGGTPWTLADGRAGILVDVTSANSIAAGMRRVAEDPDLREQLSFAGREQARSHYQIDTAASQYETLLTRASEAHVQ